MGWVQKLGASGTGCSGRLAFSLLLSSFASISFIILAVAYSNRPLSSLLYILCSSKDSAYLVANYDSAWLAVMSTINTLFAIIEETFSVYTQQAISMKETFHCKHQVITVCSQDRIMGSLHTITHSRSFQLMLPSCSNVEDMKTARAMPPSFCVWISLSSSRCVK